VSRPEDRRERRLSRGASHRRRRAEGASAAEAEAGHFAKAQVEPGQGLWEFRLGDGEGAELKPGAEIKVDVFKKGQLVDVAGVTKGKGLLRASSSATTSRTSTSRTATRCRTARRARSASAKRRAACSRASGWRAISATIVRRRSILEVLRVDAERNVLLVKGCGSGAENGRVIVSTAAKGQPVAPKVTPKAAQGRTQERRRQERRGKKDAAKDKK
jgi:large subunit ribosomal protein L3